MRVLVSRSIIEEDKIGYWAGFGRRGRRKSRYDLSNKVTRKGFFPLNLEISFTKFGVENGQDFVRLLISRCHQPNTSRCVDKNAHKPVFGGLRVLSSP